MASFIMTMKSVHEPRVTWMPGWEMGPPSRSLPREFVAAPRVVGTATCGLPSSRRRGRTPVIAGPARGRRRGVSADARVTSEGNDYDPREPNHHARPHGSHADRWHGQRADTR